MKLSLLFTTLIFFAITGKTQPGTLDESFGIEGKTTTNFGKNTSPEIFKAVLQNDNKIIEIGTYHSDKTDKPQGFFAVRYTADGFIDSSFGENGKQVIQFSFADDSYAYDAAVQNTGKILLAGTGWQNYMHPVYSGIISRLNTNGFVDSSFGNNGSIQTTSNGRGGYGAIAVQSDNKIVAVGGAGDSSFVVRYLEDGHLDESFGENGYTLISNYFYVLACKIQTDGKIVAGGYNRQQGISKFCLQRFLSDGAIDRSFGNNGTIIMAYGGDKSQINDLTFQFNEKILAAGLTTTFSTGETNFAIARYNQNGSLDSTFGINGKNTIVFPNGTSLANSIIVQNDNAIIIGGLLVGDSYSSFAVVKLTPSGSLDSSFGVDGEVITDFGYSSVIKSVLLQSNGKIIGAGVSGIPPIFNCSIARYNNDLSRKQIIITKIRKWIQHHNGFIWDGNSNINSYVVQRSYDGIHFNSIARVNSGNHSNYIYQDASPLSGTNYYRLQTTSRNGSVNYSNIIAVSNTDIKISPNPATNSLRIEGLSSSNKTKITVIDFSGNEKLQVVANNSSYSLNIALLKAGNYLLKIEVNDETITKKFVKE